MCFGAPPADTSKPDNLQSTSAYSDSTIAMWTGASFAVFAKIILIVQTTSLKHPR